MIRGWRPDAVGMVILADGQQLVKVPTAIAPSIGPSGGSVQPRACTRAMPGDGVLYSQRLSAERTRSRLSKIIGTPLYRSMTIRNWSTTMKLWGLMTVSEPL